MDPFNLNNITPPTINFISPVEKIMKEQQKSFEIIAKENARKEAREEENRENLRKAAENTEITVKKLEKQIEQKDEDLQNQRDLIDLLKKQLTGINRTLSDLFILQENTAENQEKAEQLAKEIYAAVLKKERIDWKTLAIDKGIDIVTAAIPIILELVKVMPN